MKILSEKLKDCRKENGLSQESVAKILEINRVTYTGYEVGRHEPSLETLVELADMYKVSTDYLLGRYDRDHKKAKPKKVGNTFNDALAIDKVILQFFAGLSSADKKTFLSGKMTFDRFEKEEQFKKLSLAQKVRVYREYESGYRNEQQMPNGQQATEA